MDDLLEVGREWWVIGRECDLTGLAEEIDHACVATDRLEDHRRACQAILARIRFEQRERDRSGQQRKQIERERRPDGTIERESRRRAKGIKQRMAIVWFEHQPARADLAMALRMSLSIRSTIGHR